MDFLREIVSGPKHRFKQNGYNLDLTYITDRIIAMAFPASGIQKLYRNSIDDVVQFLRERHNGSHWIVNISGREIDQTKLKNTNSYEWEDHCAPPMQTLFTICEKMHGFLKESEKNVVAIHCNHGKGRTGTIICCFLLYTGQFIDPGNAMMYYAKKRFEREGMGVTQPCQIRYINYFHQLLSGAKRSPSVVAITKIVFQGKCRLSNPYIKVKLLSNKVQMLTTKEQDVLEDENKNIMIINPKKLVYFTGDVVIFVNNDNIVDKKVGRISLNTAFIPENNILTFQVKQISPDSLQKSNTFDPGFILSIHFKSICQCKNNIPFSQRCNICTAKLDAQEPSWQNIYRIIEKQSIEERAKDCEKVLFGCSSKVDIDKILNQKSKQNNTNDD